MISSARLAICVFGVVVVVVVIDDVLEHDAKSAAWDPRLANYISDATSVKRVQC